MTPPPLWLAITRAARADERLRGEDAWVLLYCVEKLSADEPRVIRSERVARRTRVRQTHVSRAVARLVEFGYLREHPRTGLYTLDVPTPPALAAASPPPAVAAQPAARTIPTTGGKRRPAAA